MDGRIKNGSLNQIILPWYIDDKMKIFLNSILIGMDP